MKTSRLGFSLVELLIVIAVIGILAGLLSTAILNVMKTAGNNKNQNDSQLIHAAIMEYWHDMGRWPIPTSGAKSKPEYKKTGESVAVGADNSSATDVYSYSLSFYEDNNLVIKELLDAKLPSGGKKTYLQLKGLLTPEDSNLTAKQYPCSGVADAGIVAAGDATYSDPNSDNYGSKIPARKDPVIVYRAEFIVCPHCDTAYTKRDTRKTCTNSDCDYYEQNDEFYRFSARERKRTVQRGIPYRITFDFNNKTCSVSAN